ncbi:hypothetical protein EVC62_02230 [Salinicola endophyticus]|uniref:Uncharacterized protein n=1 Tax=Salinicola endophyticus TaxID=1949083 RepID=A0ABY8FC89_9GAMM|nr:hypothetical protein [Salinicola endophyticus]WFF40411.1 hypothetical protein EVC62_02230 [Salinicola endophyticus]
MADYEAGTVNHSDLVACGVRLSSRHGLAWEMRDLLAFAVALKERGVEHLVESAWYDSNSNCCYIEIAERWKDDMGLWAVEEAAKIGLTQYEWNGVIQHGEPQSRDVGDEI